MRQLWDPAVRAPVLLVATDYDGTISEIAPRPDQATTLSGAVRALAALAKQGVHVAIVSGRRPDEIASLTAELGEVIRICEHGAVIDALDWRDAMPPPSAALLDRLVERGRLVAQRHDGLLVEPKMYGVALHVRALSEAARRAAAADLDTWAESARQDGMDVMLGRSVVEARVTGASKAAALARVLEMLPSSPLLVYAGDDETDEAALELALERGGIGVRIASGERGDAGPASVVVDSPAAWIRMLEELVAARATSAAP